MGRANPDTVVEWQHQVAHGGISSGRRFKYVFWAFGPAIQAFQVCRPVISVDGTFLRGAYRATMLVAVTHDANDYVLPIAFAIVDVESTDSWTWFMRQLRAHVARDRQHVCIISDRHTGLKGAMRTMEEWAPPSGYHRFCLRHIRSNFARAGHRNANLKNLAWQLGSVTEVRKWKVFQSELEMQSAPAWAWLHRIPRQKWCVAFDGNRRWGILTTNVSESYNNVLRGARHLPITACVNATFQQTVKMFADRSMQAQQSRYGLPPRIWRKFRHCDNKAGGHRVAVYDLNDQVYKVTTKNNRPGSGGRVHTVKYLLRSCTCRKWQIYRLPCSHALAVCRHRRDNPLSLCDPVYSVATFRVQYDRGFTPLRNQADWRPADWRLLPDTQLFRSRRRGILVERRIRNEMDERARRQRRTCTNCRRQGHDSRTCPGV